jgi:hypothetical protein
MEGEVEKVAANILKQPTVSGVACLDKNGLCCVAKGTAAGPESSFGLYKAISRRAGQVSANSGIPVVKIELDSPDVSSVTIKDYEDMTIIVHRS